MKTKKFSFTVLLVLSMLLFPYLIYAHERLIVVNTAEKTLYLFSGEELQKKYPVRIGKETTPTPKGEGYIYIKRDRPVFRYQDPPNRGKIIQYYTSPKGEKVKIPQEKMRSLGFRITGYNTDRYSIHSTTAEETIGQSSSSGCVGMNIYDLLDLYPLIQTGDKIMIY